MKTFITDEYAKILIQFEGINVNASNRLTVFKGYENYFICSSAVLPTAEKILQYDDTLTTDVSNPCVEFDRVVLEGKEFSANTRQALELMKALGTDSTIIRFRASLIRKSKEQDSETYVLVAQWNGEAIIASIGGTRYELSIRPQTKIVYISKHGHDHFADQDKDADHRKEFELNVR